MPYDRDRRDKPGDDEGEWVELVEVGFSAPFPKFVIHSGTLAE